MLPTHLLRRPWARWGTALLGLLAMVAISIFFSNSAAKLAPASGPSMSSKEGSIQSRFESRIQEKLLEQLKSQEEEEKPAVVPPRESRFLSYVPYQGRFGNQLNHLEWAYRLAALTNRTLVLAEPHIKELYVALPTSWERADSEYTIWDLALLKSGPVKFRLFEDEEVVPEAHPNCIWANNEKFIVSWILQKSELPECERHIYFKSGNGIINEYRSDTRSMGMDPLLFWKYWRFRKEVWQIAQVALDTLLAKENAGSKLGIHVRTFREANSNQEKVTRMTASQQRNMPLDIARTLEKREKCKCPILALDESKLLAPNPVYWDGEHAKKMYPFLGLNLTSDMTQLNTLTSLTKRTAARLREEKFLVATDHNDPQVAQMLSEYGAVMIDFDKVLPLNLGVVPRQPFEKWRVKLEGLVVDMAAMCLADEFAGVPLSSLTRAICMWRISLGKTENAMCDLLLLRTYSWRCNEEKCIGQTIDCCGD